MRLWHYDHDGRARFVTFGTHRHLKLLTDERFCDYLVKAISQVRAAAGLRVLGYVIMPEHVHAVLLPPLSARLGPLVGEIKRLSARSILGQLRSSVPGLVRELTVFRNGVKRTALWQRRCYDYNCRTESEMWKAVEYCHQNPMKEGLVENAAAWRWSSYRWYHDLPDIALEMDAY